jgi:hypothetical protein
LSTEGKTHLQIGRLVYGGGDLPKEGKTRLRRERLVFRREDLSTKGRDLSTEGETRLLRGRLVYRGGSLSTEGETLLLLFPSTVHCLIYHAKVAPNYCLNLRNRWRTNDNLFYFSCMPTEAVTSPHIQHGNTANSTSSKILARLV